MNLLFLPIILPIAHAWITAQERRILAEGTALSPAQLADAVVLGVAEPARVRVLHVERVPFPTPWLTDSFARLAGARIAQTAGLSAGAGIFIRTDMRGNRRLLAHELTHTAQYERLGGIRPFLRQYLRECLTVGYAGAGLELEASAAALALCDSP